MPSQFDFDFEVDASLEVAIDYLTNTPNKVRDLPSELPESGMNKYEALEFLAPHILGKSARLGSPESFAHMDPPTPTITWAITMWNSFLNQNLLHSQTSPFARVAEKTLFDWLCPLFGMEGGHMCSGSTVANLTALWTARESKNIKRIVASKASHISIKKAANILRIPYHELPTKKTGELERFQLGEISDACLVLNCGTTSTGEIDPLDLAGQAKWTHIDAAWGGPLKLSDNHAHKLKGIERGDSIAISGHKLLMQPKDSALVMFRDIGNANNNIGFNAGYFMDTNVGIQGSRGAAATVLLGTLILFGKAGFNELIDHLMSLAELLAKRLISLEAVEVLTLPKTGIVVFRPKRKDIHEVSRQLSNGIISTCTIQGEKWFRAVAANPFANIDLISEKIEKSIES